jgi:ABC transport system ATP-binding/permease protein
MALISLKNAHLAFGHVALLDSAELAIEPGERIALIGRNGTGKSSLLKIITGRATLDDGELNRQGGIDVSFVDQEPELDGAMSVAEAVAEGLGPEAALLADYRRTADALAHAHGQANEAELTYQLAALQQQLDTSGGWVGQHRVDEAVSMLSLDSATQISTLSGGGKKRVALARALVRAPDLLILDEPTNHLDIGAITWLEGLVQSFKGAVLLVTHDRRFLDNVASRIVELDRGRLLSYPGKFSQYQTRKAEQLEVERVVDAKFDKLLKQEEVWIRKGVEARRTRNEGRVRRLEALRRAREARKDKTGSVSLAVDDSQRSGKVVAELTDVYKAFGDKRVVQNLSLNLMRGDKLAIVGPNGAGKTTLIKLILGELAPDQGKVKTGHNLQVAYFDQFRAALDENAKLSDVVSPGSEWVEIGNDKKHVMSYLGDFLFAPERAHSPVRSLSGGERARLLLARLFAKPANVLVLDEPTNDLDMDTLELLEALLQDYTGTVLLVSHDRTFLDNVATQTIAFDGEVSGAGTWIENAGGYADWETYLGRRSAALAAQSAKKPMERANSGGVAGDADGKGVLGRGVVEAGVGSGVGAGVGAGVASAGASASVGASASSPPSSAKAKLSYKESRELAELPARIASLESEQATLTQRMQEPEFYKAGAEEIRRVQERIGAIEESLMTCLERWELLEGRK